MNILDFQQRIKGLMEGTVDAEYLADDVFLLSLEAALNGETMLGAYLQLEDLDYDILELQAFIIGYGMGQKLIIEETLEQINSEDENIH